MTSRVEQSELADFVSSMTLEAGFCEAWQRLSKLPVPICQHTFHPTRKWRFDFAWVTQRVAVEINGGTFVQGRHNRGGALHQEYDKLNAAVVLGWRVLVFDTIHLKNIAATIETVEKLLRQRA